MDVQRLKEYVLNNHRVGDILQDIGCHHVRYHSSGNYYTAANKDGDNQQAIVVYCSPQLTTIDYTRQLVDSDRATDLLDLVCFNKGLSFPKALKFVSNEVGLDYYTDFDEEEELPESIQITRLLISENEAHEEVDNTPVKPISKAILGYYKPFVNDMFAADGINYETQELFGIGYDEETNRITIPIYSELGDLVGVKGRLFKKDLAPGEMKYIYLEPTSRSKILYGLNLTYSAIRKKRTVFVVEAEKGVMQAYSHGVHNVVATGGKKISKQQINMLTRLDCKVILCYDKDVKKDELKNTSNKFMDGVKIYAVCDDDGILSEKESPTDDMKKFKRLVKNNCHRLK